MRSTFVIASLVALLVGCAGKNVKFDCQPLCAPPGSDAVIGGNVDYEITADDEDGADASCVQKANNDAAACTPGDVVVRCSCEEE